MFPRTYRAIAAMALAAMLETQTARDIMRKSGFIPGSATSGGSGTSVLSCAAGPYPRESETFGLGNIFDWEPMPDKFEWWPEGFAQNGPWTTTVDLSGALQMRHSWHVGAGYANPDANIRVEASLDNITWEYATSAGLEPFDWTIAGANVNCGSWLVRTAAEVPYANYPPYYPDREGVENALPGGVISSGWQPIRADYRAEDVHLRFVMDWSHLYDDDPYYLGFDTLRVGYGDVRVR